MLKVSLRKPLRPRLCKLTAHGSDINPQLPSKIAAWERDFSELARRGRRPPCLPTAARQRLGTPLTQESHTDSATNMDSLKRLRVSLREKAASSCRTLRLHQPLRRIVPQI